MTKSFRGTRSRKNILPIFYTCFVGKTESLKKLKNFFLFIIFITCAFEFSFWTDLWRLLAEHINFLMLILQVSVLCLVAVVTRNELLTQLKEAEVNRQK